MRHSRQDDPNLSEVKAVLERLQRISRSPDSGGQHVTDKGHTAQQPAEGSPAEPGIAPPLSNAAPDGPAKASMRRVVGVASVIAGLLFALAAVYFARWTDATIGPSPDAANKGSVATASSDGAAQLAPPVASSTPADLQSPKSQGALQAASGFMASGQVQAARTELLSVVQEGSPDVAWALARSYDPNFLSTISAANASPDVVEATRWYRTWYDIAVKQGLVSDSVSLERIIRSMH
jgi:hypothetical protein